MSSNEAVNRLVDISHCEKPHTSTKAEAHNHAVQSRTEVLILVNDQDRVFRKQCCLKPRVLSQRTNCEKRHVIEVNEPTNAELGLIGLSQPCQTRIRIPP
ncbi:hypothetical protein Rmet_6732 (plasmid) [Cupriavidus metallidurans CH34]|uniref:Uncharacterized protein n=1 Tax=Cupriavidus metallidurans (strain ATCC 43123 / DSM 2839 / NBRC 102507 / CH34) TaxID=266264 RepID=D3DYE1_CUPMC|nr:hypothetical protein Rmet_6732 [Cupriavidus metallidurans CH34]